MAMAGWLTRKESNAFVMAGKFSNGGLDNKKRIECISYDGGPIAMVGSFTRMS